MNTTRSCDFWTDANSDAHVQVSQILHRIVTLKERIDSEPVEPPSLIHTEVMLEQRVHYLTDMLFRIRDAIDAATFGICAAVLSGSCIAHAFTDDTYFLVGGWISFMSILGLWLSTSLYVRFQLRKL